MLVYLVDSCGGLVLGADSIFHWSRQNRLESTWLGVHYSILYCIVLYRSFAVSQRLATSIYGILKESSYPRQREDEPNPDAEKVLRALTMADTGIERLLTSVKHCVQ